MLKKLVVGTVLAGCLLSCGKYSELENKLDKNKLAGLPGSAAPATVLEGTWQTACTAQTGSDSYWLRESIYDGNAFRMRFYYFEDSLCKEPIAGREEMYEGTFKIGGASQALPGATEADFTFSAPISMKGTVNYTIFKIDNGALRFGGTWSTTPQTRSTTLDNGPALKKID